MGEAGPVFTRPVRMLAFVSVALLVWMNVDHGPAFRAATGQSLPDLSVAGYDEAWLRALAARVAERPEAQTVLSRLHAGPDLVLPFALAALGIALILRLAPGNRIFGQTERPTLRLAVPEGPGGDFLFGRIRYDWAYLGIKVERAAKPADAFTLDEDF